MSKTRITYNRQARQYEVHNGRLLETFPAGPEGQQAAVQCALKADDPEAYRAAFYLVYDLFRGYDPSLHQRIWRAAALVAAGDVRPPYQVGEEPNTVSRVRAQSKDGTPEQDRHYLVQRHPNRRYSCDCFDFVNDAAPKVQGQKLCKHILALKIMKLIGRDLPAWPELDAKQAWLLARQRQLRAQQEELRDDEILRHARAKARRAQLNLRRHNQAMQAPKANQQEKQP